MKRQMWGIALSLVFGVAMCFPSTLLAGDSERQLTNDEWKYSVAPRCQVITSALENWSDKHFTLQYEIKLRTQTGPNRCEQVFVLPRPVTIDNVNLAYSCTSCGVVLWKIRDQSGEHLWGAEILRNDVLYGGLYVVNVPSHSIPIRKRTVSALRVQIGSVETPSTQGIGFLEFVIKGECTRLCEEESRWDRLYSYLDAFLELLGVRVE